jgi:hypothetical protein
MELERRGFLKALTIGAIAGCSTCAAGLGEQISAPGPGGELQAGSGSLHLRGRLKAGILTLDAQEFLYRVDRSVIVRGKLAANGKRASGDLYSAMFSHEKDRTVFALFQDSGHSTNIILSDSTDPKVGHLVVWNDNNSPQIHEVEKRKILEADDARDVRDIKGKTPDLVGNRISPGFTWQELERVFGDDPALLQFMRGAKAIHKRTSSSEWACYLLSMVPASTLSLVWLAR